jgi:DNA-binding transcriptional regulator YdaS (Cro superfamily)
MEGYASVMPHVLQVGVSAAAVNQWWAGCMQLECSSTNIIPLGIKTQWKLLALR